MRARKAGPKKFRIPTPQSLANIALHYLARYAASEASLRRMLENRLRRAGMSHPDFAADHAHQAELRTAIEQLIFQHRKTGALNDAAFAEMKVGSLRRAGRSRRVIAQKLAVKGIEKNVIAKALEPEDGKVAADDELQAAMRLAQRRRLGRFRTTSTATPHPDQHRKDIATMARAGFSFDIIKQVLGNVGDAWEE